MEIIKTTGQREQEKRDIIRRNLLASILTYIIIISFLAILNVLTSPGYYWVIWPALGWGLGLMLHIVHILLKEDK